MRDLIERARRLAKSSRLTPPEIALKCGVSQRFAYKLLRDEPINPPYKLLHAVIEAFQRKRKPTAAAGVE